ncbi:DODA-type extradiol aromatic ring-opening family dioxygenase [Pseudomonadota bacterium]
MTMEISDRLCPVLYIPHGGGPLPLLGDESHQRMVDFLKEITPSLGRPTSILLISAHWEEDQATITSGKSPQLIYDYFGFPEESYNIEYPAIGNSVLAARICRLLEVSGIEVKKDDQRGFDHGMFVPLKIMYPQADIPCVQLSLVQSLDAETHLKIGKALSALREENILVIGSGFSFHNLRAFRANAENLAHDKNDAFEYWLIDTCTSENISSDERNRRLADWEEAPHARYCQPREEHLLPLHVCCGMSNSAAKLVFEDKIMGAKASAFLW